LQVFDADIASLIPDPNNARKHDEKNLASIKGSLAKFGQQTPIVIDSNNVILKGNGTVEAAKQLGWANVKCIRTTLETNTDKVAYALADNRSSELAAWNMDVLGSELLALQEDNFDISEIGFDPGDYGLDEPDLKNLDSKEFDASDFSNFQHQCPKCGFEFNDDSKSTTNGAVVPD
jgi:ParB-like chromosome segregation protein Spo0J